MNAPMANLPVVIFQFAMSPYEDWQPRLGRRALITLAVLAQHPRRALLPQPRLTRRTPSHGRQGRHSPRDRASAKLSVRNLNFYYGGFHALKNVTLDIPEQQGDRLHRPLGLRQVDAAAHLQPHVRALPRAARRGRDPDGRREPADLEAGRLADPRQDRHGVPEADAVPDVDLRQHRLRRAPVRDAAAARWTSASSGR